MESTATSYGNINLASNITDFGDSYALNGMLDFRVVRQNLM